MGKQFQFNDRQFKKPADRFGGSLLNGNSPKTKRPLESKFPIHLVLRAKKGGMRQPKTLTEVNRIVAQTALKHGVKIYRYANVGNHLHLAIKLSRVSRWAAFIRELSGRLAYLMRKMGITKAGETYWLHRPFTSIVRSWQKGFRTLCEYVYLNWLEAEGFINRAQTKTLKDLRELLELG